MNSARHSRGSVPFHYRHYVGTYWPFRYGNPVFFLKRWFETWVPAFAGTTVFLFLSIASVAAEEALQEITVNPGDTMWSIANKYLKDPQKWPEIVKYNKLPTADPTLALPGSKIKVPVLLIKEEYQNAQLLSTILEVRYKRKGQEEWHEAQADMTLKYEDSLRTMKGGQARVRFPTKEIVQINENSYVVLKPEKILQEIQLLQGDVRAARAKVIMPSGAVVLPKGGNSDYQAKIREDKTEVVFVYKGKVDVSAQGKTITVPEGFGTQVPKSAPPLPPQPLSSFKDFNPTEMTTNAPDFLKVDPTKNVVVVKPPSPSTKDGGARSKAVVAKDLLANYHLQVSKDEKFSQIVYETTQPTGKPFDLKKQPFPDGSYYMRVAFIDALGVQGAYSVPSLIVKDTVAPKFENLTPADGQQFHGEEAYCDVIGTVQGAAMVAVNGDVVFIGPTGRFDKFLTLSEGVNKIKVVARDVNGNETVVERQVTYSKNK